MKKSSGIQEKLCQGKDIFERMNYLHQASLLVSSKNVALGSYYNSILTGCAKKSVLRIDHNLKRMICKSCYCPLVPGKTAKVRLMSKKKKLIKTVCNMCKNTKRIPTKKNNNLWSEQPQAILQTFEYGLKLKSVNNKKEDGPINNTKKDDLKQKAVNDKKKDDLINDTKKDLKAKAVNDGKENNLTNDTGKDSKTDNGISDKTAT